MSFFIIKSKAEQKKYRAGRTSKSVSTELLHKMECKACPLAAFHDELQHPDMRPTGSDDPIIYVLGEAPGKEEDVTGTQFIGKAGRTLRSRIPDDWIEDIRFNNCVRTRPPGNQTPGFVEIECCRPSIVRDIERTKPKAIFGFGGVPLHWAIGQTGITKWCGRSIPIRVGSHTCWFFPMLHPSYVNRKRTDKDRDAQDIEFQFELNLRAAFDAVDNLPEPIVHTKEDAFAGVSWVTGKGGWKDFKIVRKFIERCKRAKLVGLDYETNSLRPYREGATILTVALSLGKETLAFPLYHSQAEWDDEIVAEVEQLLVEFLYHEPGPRKAVHQLAFELEWSGHFYGKGVCRTGVWEDTTSQAFVLDERMKMGKPDAHSLEVLCIQYFGINIKQLSKLNREKLDEEPLEDVLRYNGVDAKYHRALHVVQMARLREEGLVNVYKERREAVPTMVLTQLQGLPVSAKTVEKFYRRYKGRVDKIAEKIMAHPDAEKYEKKFKKPFKFTSNHAIKSFITDILKRPVEKTDDDALKELDHPVLNMIREWRSSDKMLSTYVLSVREGSPHLFNGKIHPILSTTRTRTARSASEDPNIQNWPKRDAEQKEIRACIRPRKGPRGPRCIVSFDYGQIQARNVAMESLDKALIQAFWDEYDIHLDWAIRIADLHPKWADGKKLAKDKTYAKGKRNEAKNDLVFPWFFGAQPPSISKYLHVPIEIAKVVHEQISEMFPDVAAWQDRLRKFYAKNGYVTGLTGFRRRAPISPNQLINSPIQADEAFMVFDAMTRLSKMDYQAAMEIHDDLSFIWYKSEIERNAEVVIDEMLNCRYEWAHVVPIVVEMAVGDDWYGLKDVGVYSSATWKGDIRNKANATLVGSWDDGTGWADKEYMEGAKFSHPRRRGHR